MCNRTDHMRTVSTARKLFNLEFATAKIRELHKPVDTSKIWGMPDYGICCIACEVNGMAVDYPCPTIKALDGEQIDE